MIGKTLSHYRVVEKLGAGGMGEVYRVEDTNLSRQVAIKVLPDEFAHDAERLARFEREAKLLASLNHPNIAAIHGLEEHEGKRFLVLELVEGQTLAERLRKGSIPLDETLDICRQIAEGLEAAHEKGIIHRDLKPANVKVTPEGKVKILDFGLAKAFEGETSASDVSKSPTLTEAMTHAGVILGTAAYMSPEQAKGKPVDRRTDIWGFGCILFECLTGQRAFQGETITEIVASILKSDPDWDSVPPSVPWQIRDLIRRCLEKDPKHRLRDIGDAQIDMSESPPEPVPQRATGARLDRWTWLVAGTIIGLIAGIAFLSWSGRLRDYAGEGAPPVSRFEIPLEGGQRVNVIVDLRSVAISEDGRRIAWVGGKAPDTRIFTRTLDSIEIHPIPGTEGVNPPNISLSPDGTWVCFTRAPVLYKVPVIGGDPIPIVRAEGSLTLPIFMQWTASGIYATYANTGISLISEDGKRREDLTVPVPEQQEVAHFRPRALPGGLAILFDVCVGNYAAGHIEALDLATKQRKPVLNDTHIAAYVPTGHLIFTRAGTLLAVPFDLRNLSAVGDEKSLQLAVQMSPDMHQGYWDISQNGTLVYVPYDAAISQTHLVWVDRTGVKKSLSLQPGFYCTPTCAPDGKTLAYAYREVGGIERYIYTLEIDRNVPRRITQSGDNSYPVWSPDSTQIAYQTNRDGRYNTYIQPLGYDVPPKRLRISKLFDYPRSWSHDGKYILYAERPSVGELALYLTEPGNPEAKPVIVAASGSYESYGRICPGDSRWIAYTGRESGLFQVFIKEVDPASPASGMARRVSPSGGVEPVWSPKGDELFYRSEDGTRLHSVSFSTQAGLKLGPEKLVLDKLVMPQFEIMGNTSYDISADGKRFLMVFEDPQAGGAKSLVVVQNWFEEVKRLCPTGK